MIMCGFTFLLQSIPVNFVKKYMKTKLGERVKKDLTAKLRSSNKTWNVKLGIYTGRACRLFKGWVEFAEANRLEKGDVCVFELTNTDRFVFDITIFKS